MSTNGIWIYGKHAILGVLASSSIVVEQIVALEKYKELFDGKNLRCNVSYVQTRDRIDKLLPSQTNGTNKNAESKNIQHQGIAAFIKPPSSYSLNDILDSRIIIVLDEITDINNIGAIIRSVFAFKIDAILVSKRLEILKKPEIYKTSSGYAGRVKVVEVSNVSEALQKLKQNKFWVLGMQLADGQPIKDAKQFEKVALVLGSEGKGLRNLTQKRCDMFIKIPIHKDCESLNVSAAAAIALYELGIV